MASRRVVRIDRDPLEAAIAWLRRGDAIPVEARLAAAWHARAVAWCADPALESGWCLCTDSLLDGSPIDAMLEALHARGRLAGERLASAQLVLVEALANAVFHGNLEGRDPRDADARLRARGIGLCARRDGDLTAFSLVQEGPGQPALTDYLVTAATSEQPPDLLQVGGLGLFVIARMSARWAVAEAGRALTLWF